MRGFFPSLAVVSLSWSIGVAEVASLRGRELQSGGTELSGPCTLYKRVTDYADGSSKESWRCLLDEADGNGVYPVTEALNLTSAVSGETTLTAGGGMAVSANKTVIMDPTEAILGGETRRGRDRRLAVTGDKKFVVVRVTCGTKVVTKSLADIKADVFSDSVCLKSQMAACSNNALTISEGYNSGGVDLTISSCADGTAAENAVTDALTTLVGYNPIGGGDYFMYCMPPGIGFSGIAYGYIDARVTVYNNDWCSYVSAQMHEVGHNFNLNHATEGGDEYGDQTGFMGYSYSQDDQSMCFNAPNMYQLGWLKTVTEFTSQPASGNYVLVGHTNFDGGIQAVRLQGTPTSAEDTYIWLNDASGKNANTEEGGNRVIVTTRAKGTGYELSYTQATLDVGGSYSPSGAYYAVNVLSIASGQATITFDASPSNAPVAAPPTAAPVVPPTDAPVAAPTDAPVVAPTDAPVVAPTDAPVVAPTDAPVPAPTAAPVPAPTLAPVALPTAMPVSTPLVCPPTKKQKLCPQGCVFTNKLCRAPASAPTLAPVAAPTASTPLVCPPTKKQKLCPPGCVFSNKLCRAP